MGLIDDFLAKVGALTGGAPAAGARTRPTGDGVTVTVTRDGAPVPASGLAEGHLIEVHAVLDEARTASLLPDPRVRIELVEEDTLGDDVVTSLVGPGAVAATAGTSVACTMTTVTAAPGQGVDWAVEEHRRTTASFELTILVVVEGPPSPAPATAPRRAHIIGWLRPDQREVGTSEYHAVVDVSGAPRASSPSFEVGSAVPGVAVRVTGALADADVPASPAFGALPDVSVTLGGRRAVSGRDGRFVVDARLPVGASVLRVSRPGITTLDLEVVVAVAADGTATATVGRGAGAAPLDSATTATRATAASLLELDTGPPLGVQVHKVRGTVLWPDSRREAGAFRRTPLAQRRVYLLPVPPGADALAARPRTTRAWEAMKTRPDVLRSARPGEQPLGARTDADGRFEVRYVDMVAGSAFLIWVERFDGEGADTATEAPDHVVRASEVQLRHMGVAPAGAAPTTAELAVSGDAGVAHDVPRLLVDHRGLTGADMVPAGVDVVRVAEQAGRLVLVRAGAPDIAVPDSRIVDGLDLIALPVVPLAEPDGDRGRAASRAAERLAVSSGGFFGPRVPPTAGSPRDYDLGAVAVAIDAAGLAEAAGLVADPLWSADEASPEARTVALLEGTFVSRPDLAGPLDARWRVDAVSLADRSFARLQGGTVVSARTLGAHTIVPVFDAVAPRLPGARARRVYLAPGHGLWPHGRRVVNGVEQEPDASASSAPGDWRSNRGGWAGDAGEDETDALWARAAKQLLDRAGATVHTCRELDRLSERGVSNPAAGSFPPVADPAFPRLWQQNPLYALAVRPGAAALVAPYGTPVAASFLQKNIDGVKVRVAHIRQLAAARQLDLVIALHTNGGAGDRGTMVMYLNAHPAGSAAAEGNPPGHDLASAVYDQLADRCRLPRYRGGVLTMAAVQGAEAPGDLVDTFEHWSQRTSPAVARERFSTRPAVPAPPAGQPAPAFDAVFETHPYPGVAVTAAGAAVLRTPVALVELGSHDLVSDAAALARPWFRQRAAESVVMAVDERLRADTAIVSRRDVRTVLERFFGQTAAIAGLSADATPAGATPQTLQQALEAAALGPPAPGSPAPPAIQPTLGNVVDAVRAAAARSTRRRLVEAIRDAVSAAAGWEAGDAIDITRWVGTPITGGSLAREGETPTREEAGVLACRAVGLVPAGLTTATRLPAGAPLLSGRPTADGALFPEVEVRRLADRLGALPAGGVHRVTGVVIADGTRTPRWTSEGAGRHALHRGTAHTIVVQTGGAAWKTVNHSVAGRRLQDAELRLTYRGRTSVLPVVEREPTLVVSGTWIVDFPETTAADDLRVELWLRHRRDGWKLVEGTAVLRLHVLPPPP